MKKYKNIGKYAPLIIAIVLLFNVSTSCQKQDRPGKPSIVVTYSILGSIVKELVDDKADVIVSIPNGLDLHEWEPSAKDIEAINNADLVIQNGLYLEAGMEKCLQLAEEKGVKFFTASDHITPLYLESEGEISRGDHDHPVGAPDPHLWTDPVMMKAVVEALVPVLKRNLNIDVSDRGLVLADRLDELDRQIFDSISSTVPEDRKLVTGHKSMGYFAERYSFRTIGVIIPGLSSQASISAADLSRLKKSILDNRVKVIFTEQGTSPAVAKTIADETGVKVVELRTHKVPPDGSYFSYMKDMVDTITNVLKQK